MNPHPTSRRAWLLAAGASALAIIGGIIAYFLPRDLRDTPAEPVRAGALDELEARGYLALAYGAYPAIVVSTEAGPVAYSRVCTHFSCTVEYDPGAREFRCPCHDARFAGEDGRVLAGPPSEPLRRFDLFVEDGQVYLGSR
ncbi:MAG: Rieske (2Fe-2S) protein [Anaerolineae bacterium]|nr:Rieske (2Fe-2S) protein [Anaerolineae bacterium]